MTSGGAGRAAAVRAAKCPSDRTLPPFRQMQTAPAAPNAPAPRPPTARATVRRLTHEPRTGWREMKTCCPSVAESKEMTTFAEETKRFYGFAALWADDNNVSPPYYIGS